MRCSMKFRSSNLAASLRVDREARANIRSLPKPLFFLWGFRVRDAEVEDAPA